MYRIQWFGCIRLGESRRADTYVIDSVSDWVVEAPDAGDIVIEDLNAGTDTVYSNLINYTLTDNVENLTLNLGTNQDGVRTWHSMYARLTCHPPESRRWRDGKRSCISPAVNDAVFERRRKG